MDVAVHVMPTVREENDLAMSSRNAYLTSEERAVSGIVYKSLCAGRDAWAASLGGAESTLGGAESTVSSSTVSSSTVSSSTVSSSTVSSSTLSSSTVSSSTVSSSTFSSALIQQSVVNVLSTEPLVSEIEYVSVDSRNTMMPIDEVGIEGCNISLAVKVGTVRLIDNINVQ